MAIEIIPDKICPKCEGTKWYRHTKGHYECSFCKTKGNSKWQNTHKEYMKIKNLEYYENEKLNLSDVHVRRVFQQNCKNNGFRIDTKMLTSTQLQRQRESIETSRKLKETNKQLKSEKIMTTITKRTRTEIMKENWAKRKAQGHLTKKSLQELTEASIGASLFSTGHVKNPEYVRRAEVAKANKQAKLAIIAPVTNVSSIGALESLFNDIKNLTNKKQEILNHLEAIKQLINQF